MLIAALLLAATPDPQEAWLNCIAEEGTKLRHSSEEVGTVADAVMYLCKPMEAAAHASIDAGAARVLVDNKTASSQAEADSLVASISDKMWIARVKDARSRLMTYIVSDRAGVQPTQR